MHRRIRLILLESICFHHGFVHLLDHGRIGAIHTSFALKHGGTWVGDASVIALPLGLARVFCVVVLLLK